MADSELREQLDSVEEKVMRALHHLNDLYPRVERVAPQMYTISRQFETDGRTEVYTFHELEPLPPDLASVFGDFLSNMYAALNHLAFALHIAHSGFPTPRQEARIAYPLVVNKGGYKTPRLHFEALAKKHIWGIHPKARAVIEENQPYHGGNGAFRWLYELSRIDRHRRLTPSYMTWGGLSWWGDPDGEWVYFSGQNRLEDGAEIGRFRWNSDPDPNMKFTITPDISVSDGTSVMPMHFLLFWIYSRVLNLRDRLYTFL
jgi:hypothetical protein